MFLGNARSRRATGRKRVFSRPVQFESLESRSLLASDFGFAVTYGSRLQEWANAVASDAQGNVYTTGLFHDAVDFDPGPGTVSLSTGDEYRRGTFITKHSPQGDLIWAKALSSTGEQWGRDIVLDTFGNVWIYGEYYWETDFDPGPGQFKMQVTQQTIGGANYLLKLNAAGEFLWVGEVPKGRTGAIAAGPEGTIYLASSFSNTQDLDPGPGTAWSTSLANTADAFLAKLSQSGSLIWAKAFGGTEGTDFAQDLAVDAEGNAVVTGSFTGSIDLDPGPGVDSYTATGRYGIITAIFTSKFDASGDYLWGRVTQNTHSEPWSIAIDPEGGVIATGGFTETVNIDPTGGTYQLTAPAGFRGAYITKLTANGDFAWAKQLGKPGYDTQGAGVAIHPNGDVFTTGRFNGTADFDPAANTSFNLTALGYDAYVSRLLSDGTFVSARSFSGESQGLAIALSPAAGALYIAGRFRGTVDFDPSPGIANRTAKADDIFIAKLFTGPYFTSAVFTSEENSTAVGQVVAVDPEEEVVSYSISGGADGSLFSIDAVSGALFFKSAPDFEDATHSPTYLVEVSASDGRNDVAQLLTVTVTNVSEPPTGITLFPANLAENLPIGTTVGILTAEGPSSEDELIFELVAGEGDDSNDAFVIEGNEIKSAQVFNYEAQNLYSVRIRVTDENGASFESIQAIGIFDDNEAPTISSEPTTSASEDALYSYLVEVSDGDSFLSSNFYADVLPFWLTLVDHGNGTATLRGTPTNDIVGEHPVTIVVTDGPHMVSQSFTITVENINDAPILSVNQSLSVIEGDKAFVTFNQLQATDVDTPPDQVTFTITSPPAHGQIWEHFFANDDQIDNDGDGETDEYDEAGIRMLLLGDSFDQTDIDGGRIEYRHAGQEQFEDEVQFLLTDGGFSQTIRFAIAVTPANDAPTSIKLSRVAVFENQPAGTVVGLLRATDPDSSGPFTYALAFGEGSTHNALFQIVGTELRTKRPLNYELNPNCSVRVRVTDDQGRSFEQVLTIRVIDRNEAPRNLGLSRTTVPENRPAGTLVGKFFTSDPDANNTFTYLLVSGEGATHNGAFEIVGNELRTKRSFNYEGVNTLSIRVRSFDQGGQKIERVFTIQVTDVNEAPNRLALSRLTVFENRPAGTLVGTFQASDPDANSTFTYALVSGEGATHNSSFEIVGNELRTRRPLDYETTNRLSLRVRVTDQSGQKLERVFLIDVLDGRDA